MSVRLGISILDLLPLTTGAALQAPDGIVERLGILTILDHRSTVSGDFFLHEGTLQAPADALDLETNGWPLRIPGLTHGLPFRLAIRRSTAPAGQQEGTSTTWALDLEVRDIEVTIPGVRAARPVGGTGTVPLSLEPSGTNEATKRVSLVARGVVRISGGDGIETRVQLVDAPDPLDPEAPTGSVVRLTARPPHFLVGESQFGMTLDQFVLDLSETFTPSTIAARGHDESWRGVAFRETTFYFPPSTPIVHSLSVGARDVILGSPGGLQGELRVEFGEDFNDLFNSRLTIEQQSGTTTTEVAETTPLPRGTTLEYAVALGAGGVPRRVRAIFDVSASPIVPGLAAVGVWWKLPNGSEGNSAITPWFEAPTTDLLKYRLRLGAPSTADYEATPPSAVPEDQVELVEVSVRFPRPAGGPSGVAPIVDADIGGTIFANVLHLRGPRVRLAGVVLKVRGSGPAAWKLGTGSAPATANSLSSFTLPMLPDGLTTCDLTVVDGNGTRRIRLEVVPQGPLAVGHQVGEAASDPAVVTVVGSGIASPTAVNETFLAAQFHLRAERSFASTAATFSGTQVTVPQGTDAEVEVPIPTGATDPLPAPVLPVSTTSPTVQVLFEWAVAEPVRVKFPYDGGPTGAAALHEPDALPMALALDSRAEPIGSDVVTQLKSWIAALGPPNARKYFVVGRTDDLKWAGTAEENEAYNDVLASDRAAAAVRALEQAGVPLADITSRRERIAFPSVPPGSPPPRIVAVGRLALPPTASTPPPPAAPVWNKRWNPDATTTATHQVAKDDPNRPPYRCTEIYAVDTGSPAPPPAPPPAQGGVPTRMLVPGPDGAPLVGVPAKTADKPPIDYRVRLRVKWDSPTVVSLADAIPTEAEALVAWKPAVIELPATATGGASTLPPPTGPDFWEIVLRWAYDARTGQTEASGALSLPDGALSWDCNLLAGALAFGPALTALLNSADVVSDSAGQVVAAAALIAVGAAIGEGLNDSGPESTVDIDRFALSYKWSGAARVSATVDYTVDLRVNVDMLGAGSLVGRLRLRYKGVGLVFDGAPGGGLAGVALTYDELSVEVADPGTWSLGGPLGNLIRIAASRMGNGSTWMEFDLEFALDLGVVRLEGATIRLFPTEPAVEVRGLTASVDIPGALRGRGSVSIGDGGSFRALLSLEVIPAMIGAYGALAIDQDFVAVEVGVQLPVGIPLGQTGFGIFGFMGRFAANGTRNLDNLRNPDTGLASTDPVQRQLDWYARPPEDKYSRLPGQFAVGIGAVVGTLPDGGFTFNAEGSLTLGFPDVSIVFGIDAKLVSERKSAATESGTGSSGALRILGMILIEPESIMVAARANYQIPEVLELNAPISAFFPLAGGSAWFLRIGTDNHADRPGSPVTITLLPSILAVKAWAFVMVEERELLGLGGTVAPADLIAPLDFHGFSVGMGAGFGLEFKAGPFSVELTAFLLVGIGTKPLLFAGAAGVKGELDLVVVSVGADGLVHFHVSPGYTYLEGHFCGHVDCWLFEVSGCVDVRIGDDPPVDIPEPPSPIAGMDLCDHLSAVKGKGSRIASEPVPIVWPDTTAVLKFTHFTEDGLGASDFVRRLVPPAPLSPWSGSTELKYAFRLKTVQLWKLTGSNPNVAGDWTQVSGPFDSAWWLPTHRSAVIQGGDEPGPSTEEGRELGLFSWDPRAWSRWLGEGAESLPGDPANTVEVICDPPAPADPSCTYGKDKHASPGTLGTFRATPREEGAAFPSRYVVSAALSSGLEPGMLAALGGDAGWTWLPGSVAPLHGAVVLHGSALAEGWRFPSLREVGRIVATAPVRFSFSKPLVEGEVILEACIERERAKMPSRVQCDAMPKEDAAMSGFVGESGTKYAGRQLRAFASGPERALLLGGGGGLTGHHPNATDAVAVDMDPGGVPVRLVAHAADGTVLGEALSTGPGRQWLRVEAKAIRSITIKGTEKTVIYKVCWGGANQPAILDVLDVQLRDRPVVIGTDLEGRSVMLEGEPIEARPAPGHRCLKLRYILPKGPGWTGVDVAPWARGDLSLVAVCGVTVEAATAQAADDNFRDSFIDLLGSLIPTSPAGPPARTVPLDRKSKYEIRVAWQWQGFRPSHPGDEPSPPSPGAWHAASQLDRFRFDTAEYGLASAPAPAETTSLDVDPAQGGPGYDERTFDPRGLSRYVTRASPSHEDAPHFLKDPIGFWLMVDHVDSLVGKFDLELQVKVLHSRPAPGSLADVSAHVPGTKHALDVTVSVAWSLDTLTWNAADERLARAAEEAPCIGSRPAMGSCSAAVTADLEPRSEYDLILQTAPTAGTTPDEAVVVRSHFRTSRYDDPTGLLRALGFEPTLALMPPHDAIATAALAPGGLETGDTALDAALAAMGIDPWPLPKSPRTAAIWLPPTTPGQPWQVAGILLEADEPIWRAGFRTGAQGEPELPPRLEIESLELWRTYEKVTTVAGPMGLVTTKTNERALLGALVERVRNASGTRSLFVPDVPIAMTNGRIYELSVQLSENGTLGATGVCPMLDRPLVVAQEGE